MKNSRTLLIPVLLCTFALISCNDSEFKGTAKTTLVRADDEQITNFTRDPSCIDQNKATVAPNIVLVLDNSTSLRVTDPAISGLTMRETAVMNLITSLQGIANQERNNSLADANVAITSYPYVNGPHNRWLSVNALDSNSLSQQLAFTRNPGGDTPLRQGIDLANQLGRTADTTNNRKTIYVFISDGFPTDVDALETFREAQHLNDNADVFVITNTDGSNYAQREAYFKNIVDSRSYTNNVWYNTMIGSSEEDGMMNVLADRHIIANSAGQVPALLDYIVQSSGGIQCVDQ